MVGKSGALTALWRPTRYVCAQCLQKRAISTTFLKAKDEAKRQWDAWAREIRAGTRPSVFKVLKDRGFIHAVAGDETDVENLMIEKRLGVYCGVDPTAASLHVGHMIPLMALFWMHLHGMHTVSLLGAATAKIGDPTGRTTDRPLMTPTERKANLVSIHYQLKKLWVNLEAVGARHGYKWEKAWHRELVNNATWWNKVPMTDVLRMLGSGLRLGPMLSRDTVKTKMESGDGMSFSEFCYPLLQAWDWWHMYHTKGIQMQIGGSDQFGNIVAGIDAVKLIAKTHSDPDVRQEGGVTPLTTPYGITTPLLTTASGEKFGKSAGNAIWLDAGRTSIFDLYGVSWDTSAEAMLADLFKFFVRTADADVERYLKMFTFLPLPKIQSIMTKQQQDPSKRIAHHTLAFEFVSLTHGLPAATQAQQHHNSLFNKPTISSLLGSAAPSVTQEAAPPNTLNPSNPSLFNQSPAKREEGTFWSNKLNKYAPITDATNAPDAKLVLPRSLVYNTSIAKVLYSAGLVSSRSEGHRLAAQQGAYIGSAASDKQQMTDDLNFVPVKLHDPMLTWRYVIRDNSSGEMEKQGEEGLLILRVGKWKIRMIRLVTDEIFVKMGLPDPPGWAEFKAEKAALRSEQSWEEMQATQEWLTRETEVKTGRQESWENVKESIQKGKDFFREEASRTGNVMDRARVEHGLRDSDWRQPSNSEPRREAPKINLKEAEARAKPMLKQWARVDNGRSP